MFYFYHLTPFCPYYSWILQVLFCFPYNFVSFKEAPPSQLFPGAMPWRSINTDNSVIRGSNLKDTNLVFGSVSTSVTPPRVDEAGQAIFLCDYLQERNIWRPTNSFLYGAFDQGWFEFQLKYWRLCFSFCKIEVPDYVSRDLWYHQNWHVLYSNHWKFREKRFPNSASHFLL